MADSAVTTNKIASMPNGCELQDTLGRDWAIQIKPSGADAKEWMFVRGIQTISPNLETSTVDSTTIDSDGWTSETKTSRSLSVQIDGKYVTLNNLPILEKSQRLLKATGEELGGDGTLDVRYWRTDTDEGWEYNANNAFTEGGGDASGLRTFSSTMKSNCAPTRIHSVKAGAEREASKPIDVDEYLAIIRPAGAAAETPRSGSDAVTGNS